MKNFIVAFAIILLSAQARAQFTKAELQASGLTCAMCSKAIHKSLEQVPFIASVKADINNSMFIITFRENLAVDIDALKTAVVDAGFSVAKLRITGNFNKLAISNDQHVSVNGLSYHFLDVKSQVLDGEKTITIVDKDFLTSKEFRKYSSRTKKECVLNGKAADCCVKEGIANDSRIYHVTI